ncbi:MAG: S8 family peptidase [Lachnospiraceae bacterium]|nr:S8 family peptidase [Lachnospiraceae bacterium]
MNQKADTLLNLALDVPEAERERTGDLNVGYNPGERTWELIVKYSGDLEGALFSSFPAEQYPGLTFYGLLGGFAVLTVPESLVSPVIGLEQIEYAEKPKRLYFAVNQARAASCFLQVQQGAKGLFGRGILVAVIDSGIDYFHDDFRNADKSTRIVRLFDQMTGVVYEREQINEALRAGSREAARKIVPSFDTSGHGSAVAGIAAGNGQESDGRYRGAAPESDLLIVRLGTAAPDGFPRTTQVMEGVDFAIRSAEELGMPVAINLSFGNTYGSHDGNGLLERYLSSMAERGRSVFVIGTGNEGDAGGHTSGLLGAGEEAIIELSVAPYETGFGVQLWKSYEDRFDVFLSNPGQTRTERIGPEPGARRIGMGQTELLTYYGEPGPFNGAQEIYVDFVPRESYVESGIWRFILRAGAEGGGRYDFWLPSSAAVGRATRFLRPTPDVTLTIPSTALRPVSVGAYDDAALSYAPFSGRGDTRVYGIQKPDLVAPGVGIVTVKAGGGYEPVTGTSFAAPFVTGAVALLMEWGIVRGNDPYLYGDKVKAYLRKGARRLPGFTEYPNPQVGYGALCVEDSLPF